MSIAPENLKNTKNVEGLRNLLLRGKTNFNDLINSTCDSMVSAHEHLTGHFESISYKASLLRKRRFTNPLTFVGEILSWCCSLTSKSDLAVLYDNDAILQTQLDAVMVSLNNIINVTKQNQIEWVTFATQVKTKFDKIDEDLNTVLNSKKYMEDYFTHAIVRTASSLTEMIVKLLASERLENIYASCAANQIPVSAMGPEFLSNEMDMINKQLGSEVELAVHSVSALYKLDIATCIFKENSLFIIVKYPLKKSQSDWRLVDATPVPFALKNSVCTLLPKPVMMITDRQSLRIMSDNQRVDCIKRPMCPLARQTEFIPNFSNCLLSLYLGQITYENMHTHCKFICRPYETPELMHVSLNTFVIVHPLTKLTLKCPNSVYEIAPVPTGSTQLEIPCKCILFSGDNIIVDRQFPCDPRLPTNSAVNTILPALWSSNVISFDSLVSTDVTFQSVDMVLSKNLSITVPNFDQLDASPTVARKVIENQEFHREVLSYSIMSTLLLFQIISFVVIFILYKRVTKLQKIANTPLRFVGGRSEDDERKSKKPKKRARLGES